MFGTLLSIVALSAVAVSQPAAAAAQPPPASSTTSAAVININTAAAKDFEGLPGVGAKMAARIIEYRDKNGPFKKVEDLMNVRGIGEKNFLKLKPRLAIAPAKPDSSRAVRANSQGN
jgi:competence protein ComEA